MGIAEAIRKHTHAAAKACLKRAMAVVDVEQGVQTDKEAGMDGLFVEHRGKGRACRRAPRTGELGER
jgi:hypothetical protein